MTREEYEAYQKFELLQFVLRNFDLPPDVVLPLLDLSEWLIKKAYQLKTYAA